MGGPAAIRLAPATPSTAVARDEQGEERAPDERGATHEVWSIVAKSDRVAADAIPPTLTKIPKSPSVLRPSRREFNKRSTSMTRLATLMFAAGLTVWGLASIPDQSMSDKGSAAHQRIELARVAHRVFLTPIQKSATSASRALALAAMPRKVPSVSE
jgi:hypothetical protein